jgi:hypothetical protein
MTYHRVYCSLFAHLFGGHSSDTSPKEGALTTGPLPIIFRIEMIKGGISFTCTQGGETGGWRPLPQRRLSQSVPINIFVNRVGETFVMVGGGQGGALLGPDDLPQHIQMTEVMIRIVPTHGGHTKVSIFDLHDAKNLWYEEVTADLATIERLDIRFEPLRL